MRINSKLLVLSALGLLGFAFLSISGLENFMAGNSKLTIPVKNMPVTTDPHKMVDIFSMLLATQIHRGLTKYDSQLNINMDLAEKINVSEDKLKYRIKLRRANFSDGTPITSAHVVNSFRRLFIKNASIASDLGYIVGADSLRKNGNGPFGVRAEDDLNVAFELSEPSAMFLKHLALTDCSILPVSKNLEFQEWGAAGAGIYRIESRTENKIELRNSGSDGPSKITILKVNEDDVFELAKKGAIDSVDGYWLNESQSLELKSKGWKETVSAITRMAFLILNPKFYPREERQFIHQKVKTLNIDSLGKSYVKFPGLFPPLVPGALPNGVKFEGEERRPKHLTIKVPKDRILIKLANLIKGALELDGIKVKLVEISIDQFISNIQTGDFEAMIVSKLLDYPDGMSVLTYFHSNSSSRGFFPSAMGIDEMLRRLQSIDDGDARVDLYRKMQEIVLQKSIVLPLVFGNDNATLWSERVSFVPPHPMGIHSLVFKDITLK